MGGASGSEAIGVWLEFGLPFRFQGEFHQRVARSVVHSGNAKRSALCCPRFWDGRPSKWHRFAFEYFEILHELEAFVRFQGGSPINPGGAFALVVLSHA